MRKIIFLILLVALGVAGYYIFSRKTALSVESVLPEQPLIYVRLNHIQENITKFASTQFWRSLTRIDIEELLTKGESTAQQELFIQMFREKLKDPALKATYQNFLSREVAFAVYPTETDIEPTSLQNPEGSLRLIKQAAESVFLVTRVDREVQAAEFVSRYFNQYGEDVTTEQISYKNHNIQLVTIPNSPVKIALVRFQDLIVVTGGEHAAQRCIDVFKKEQASLAQDKAYKKAQARNLFPADVIGYIDLKKYYEGMSKLHSLMQSKVASLTKADANPITAIATTDEIFKQIQGFELAGFSWKWAEALQVNSYLILNRALLDPEIATFFTCPPQKNETVKFVPQDILAYQWSSCLNLEQYWNQVKKELKDDESDISKRMNQFEQMVGLSVESEIIPAIGDELGGYLINVDTAGTFPLPSFLLFLEVNDRAVIEKLIGLASGLPMVKFQQETYSNVTLNYFDVPLGIDLSPAYAFVDNYFMLSLNREVIKMTIDVKEKKSKSILENPKFQKIDLRLTDENIYVQFIDMRKMMDEFKGLAEWFEGWMRGKEEQQQQAKWDADMQLTKAQVRISAHNKSIVELKDKSGQLKDQLKNLEFPQEQIVDPKGQPEDHLKDLEFQKEHMIDLNHQLEELSGRIIKRESELQVDQAQKMQMEETIQNYDKGKVEAKVRQFYMDEFVYPLMEAFKYIDSIGSRTTLVGDVFESEVYIKIE